MIYSDEFINLDISEVKTMHIRDKNFQPFVFRINNDVLSEVMADYVFNQLKQD